MIKLLIVSLSFVALLYGCIFPFEPDIEGSQSTLVIQGRVTNQEGYQYIEVSRSILLNRPDKTFPVSGCTVSIQDELGNVFNAEELQPGLYASWISAENLMAGTRYQLVLTTPFGRNYASDYEELLACPPIDSISWEFEEMLTDNPAVSYEGVRFYVNTDASGDYAKNYRWELEETWEYHSTYRTWIYYDGRFRTLNGDSDSLYYCWNSSAIPDIYTYSTRNLTSGLIRKFPLNKVTNLEDRLTVKYSLLVRQYSLTQTAYEYWEILEDQSKQTGELYEIQPSELVGNIHSLDDPRESVQGLFYSTSVEEKRILIRPGIPPPESRCLLYGFTPQELMDFLHDYSIYKYPVWLIEAGGDENGNIPYDFADQECFDCTLKGGNTIKPDFWE